MAVGAASPAVGLAAAGDGGEASPEEGVPGIGEEAKGKGKAVLVEGGRRQSPLKGIGRRRKRTRKTRRRRMRRRGDEDDDEEGENRLGQYSSTQSILLVGDGDLSFSLALATAFGSGANLVATSLDPYEALRKKYSSADSNIMNLKRLGATVFHGIDVKTMKFHTDLKNRRFDRIVYNFPHAGFKGKECEVHMINLHKKLVKGYFRNARCLLRPFGEIHVSHKTGDSYDKWDIERIAANFSLVLVEKVGFQKADYPGYNQKKGDGPMCDKPFPLGTCFTFKFKIRDLKKRKKQNWKRTGSVLSFGGSTRPSLPLPLLPFQALRWLDVPQPANSVLMPMIMPPVHPVLMPGPSLNALGAPVGIPPPMGRITSTTLLTPQGHPLYERRIIAGLLGGTTDYFSREHQEILQREYEMLRQVMPGATSLSYSAFLDNRYRESVQRQERLHQMIGYGCQ